MLTMLVGFLLIYSGVGMATGQQQGLNEQFHQNGKKLEIREVSQVDKLKEVQEIPVTEILKAEEIEAPVVAENPLQQRKVQLRDVMENRVVTLAELIEQDKQQVDKKQSDQQRELQKKMEEIKKELGEMFLEYMALSEQLAQQTDSKTAQKDKEFLGRVLKLHKEAGTVKLEKVTEADENIVKYYVSGKGVENINIGEKDGKAIYRIKTADGKEKVLTAKELGDSKLVDEIKITAELKKTGESMMVYQVKKTDDRKKDQELKMVYEFGKTKELGAFGELKKIDELNTVIELKKGDELKGKRTQLQIIGGGEKGSQAVYQYKASGGDAKGGQVYKFRASDSDAKGGQVYQYKASGGDAKDVLLSKTGEEKSLVYFSGDKEKAGAQSTIARSYAIAVDAAQAQLAQQNKVGNFQIVTQEKLQKDKKQAQLEKQLVQLQVELQAINKQAENKEVQVKLQAEMKDLEKVLSQLQKSNTASGKALQNYISVGKAGNVIRTKDISDLRKEQNQIQILVNEAKVSGDVKKAAELEKMIELFVVREAQAIDQSDKVKAQYQVATTLAGDLGASKQARTNLITASALAGSTQAARNYTSTNPYYVTSSDTQANDVLVIPSSKTMDAKEYQIAIENMKTMALILKKKQEMDATEVAYGMFQASESRIYNLVGSADDVQAIYLQGYGALFLMNVDYPLLAPTEKKVEPKKKAGDDVWEKARQEIKGGKQGVYNISSARYLLSTNKKSAQEYNEEKVEKLKQALLDSLRHASNMGHVDDSEWITIHVTGTDQPVIEIISDIKSDSEVEYMVFGATVTGDVNFDTTDDQTFTVTKTVPQKDKLETITLDTQKTSEPTYMLIQAQKRDIDRLADDRMSFEDFIEEVTVLIY